MDTIFRHRAVVHEMGSAFGFAQLINKHPFNNSELGIAFPRKGYAELRIVEWVFIDKLCKPKCTPHFVDDCAVSKDCIHGNLGDCWL